MEIAEKIKFIELCEILQRIENSNGGIQEKELILSKFIKKFLKFSQIFAQENENNCDSSFYCVLRILIPSANKTRKSYGIKMNTLGKIITKIVGLSAIDVEMFNFNNNNEKNDFANKLYSIMLNRANSTPSTKTIFEIHLLLDIIANEQRRKIEEELTKFIESTSALEQKWLMRIILKNLKIGIGEHKTFQLYHPNAKELYLRHGNLQKICKIIESGEEINVNKDDILLFQYIHPMLCQKLVITKLKTLFNNSLIYYLETKWDGERFQIHIDNGIYKYLSRNGIDYTKSFGQNSTDGYLTPFLHKNIQINVKNMIVDGEMMVWDKSLLCYRTKGENVDVKSLQIGGNLRPCFVAYDLLYLNDVCYIDRSYNERISNLYKIFKELPGVFQFCKRIKICNSEQFIEHFNSAIDNNEEGIVLKNQNSIYKPGRRNNSGWYKLKPDYVDGVISDFDLLIIGGYYGFSKNIESHKYLLGVLKNREDLSFCSTCTVSLGLSNIEKDKIKNLLSKYWQKTPPTNVEFGIEKPNVYIEPKKSIVLQIRATELSTSSKYITPYTLRFPRIQAIRNDKLPIDCMTLREFEEFCKKDIKVQKIHKRQLSDKDLSQEKKFKTNSGDPYINTIKTNEIKMISNSFEGIDFCILNGTVIEKENLKRIILNHSGKIIANPSLNSNKCICIANDQLSFQVKKLKQTQLYNIIHAEWIKRCFTQDTILCKGKEMNPKLRDIIYATSDIEKILNEKYDKNGDSYTDHVDLKEIKLLLNDIKSDQINSLTELEILNIENELYCDNPNIFRNTYGFFNIQIFERSNITSLAILKFSSRGGLIIDEKELKNILVPINIFYDSQYKLSKVQGWFKSTFDNIKTPIKFVQCNWILDSDKINKLIDIKLYTN